SPASREMDRNPQAGQLCHRYGHAWHCRSEEGLPILRNLELCRFGRRRWHATGLARPLASATDSPAISRVGTHGRSLRKDWFSISSLFLWGCAGGGGGSGASTSPTLPHWRRRDLHAALPFSH